MNIDTNTIVPISVANQNFSKVARLVDQYGSAVIMKNGDQGKDRYPQKIRQQKEPAVCVFAHGFVSPPGFHSLGEV